jgi:hypothetical protein
MARSYNAMAVIAIAMAATTLTSAHLQLRRKGLAADLACLNKEHKDMLEAFNEKRRAFVSEMERKSAGLRAQSVLLKTIDVANGATDRSVEC